MSHQEHHGELLVGFAKEYKEIFDGSDQAIYVYLDENHFACNKKFASLLGYGSPKDIEGMKGDFLGSLVSDESQNDLASTYQKAMEKFEGSSVKIAWKKKDGSSVSKNCILVPISYEGHMMALHFIS